MFSYSFLLGSREHGLFKISDNYWCSPPGKGKGCNMSCDKLHDYDIADDIRCAQRIYSAEGFNAWESYQVRCRFRTEKYTKECFPAEAGVTDPSESTTQQQAIPPGKVYGLCELAQELRFVHDLPMDQINTWVCLAEAESSFNTSAVGTFNDDGSKDHGKNIL